MKSGPDESLGRLATKTRHDESHYQVRREAPHRLLAQILAAILVFSNGCVIVEEDSTVSLEGDEIIASSDPKLIVDASGTEARLIPITRRLRLTYCVDQASFGADYQRVVGAMKVTTREWEDTMLVRFIHKSDLDGSCVVPNSSNLFLEPHADVYFAVYEVAETALLDDPENEGLLGLMPTPRLFTSPEYGLFALSNAIPLRSLLLNVSLHDNPAALQAFPELELEGTIRHELGHFFGFRHEQIHPDNPLRTTEQGDYLVISPYDPASVMHYVDPAIGGNGTGRQEISPGDRMGAVRLYGIPAAQYVPVVM